MPLLAAEPSSAGSADALPSADAVDTDEQVFKPQRRARALVEALPYIQKFHNAVVVIKYGGSAMIDPSLARSFARDIVLISSVGMRPVVVHGGGPQISEMMAQLGMDSEFHQGLASHGRRRTRWWCGWCWSAR